MRALIVRAPTRIDFGGGWTDVPPYDVEQGGCVCNVAITRHAAVNLAPAPGGVTLDSDGESSTFTRIALYSSSKLRLPLVNCSTRVANQPFSAGT